MEEIRIKIPSGKLLVKEARCRNGCSLMCPGHPLSGKPSILALVRLRGQSGHIYLNPYYGIFEFDCDLKLERGDIVDIFCPHCGTTLTGSENCHICRVPMIVFYLPAGGEVRACPVIGCHNHALTIVDLDAQLAEFYNDERRPKM